MYGSASPIPRVLSLAVLCAAWFVAGPAAADDRVSPATTVEAGWSRYRLGAWADAARLAARALEADASHVGWQRLHSRARARMDGERSVIAQHRSWMEADPADPVRRVVLADALLSAWRFDAAWCGEIRTLLEVSPAASEVRWWGSHLAERARDSRCPALDAVPEVLEDDPHPPGAVAGLLRRLLERPAAPGAAERIESLLAEDPALLGRMVGLFAEDAPTAPRSLQRSVTERAVTVSTALPADPSIDDLAQLADAYAVLDAFLVAQGRPGIVSAGRRSRLAFQAADRYLEAHHPDPHRYGAARAIHRARRLADAELALKRVEALELPDTPEVQARYHTARGDLLRTLGDLPGATAAYREAWTRTPTDPDRANWFAYHTTLLETPSPEALEEARVAATAAVDGFRTRRFVDRDWPGETYAQWRVRSSVAVAEALDTRGWTLHQLGRNEEAVSDLLEASRILDVPAVELHLGLVLVALEQPDAASVHLARGIRERDPTEARTVEAGWSALRRWWPDAGIWHPAGLEGWVTQLAGEVADPPVPPPSLVGQTLPDVEVLVRGTPTSLTAIEGPAVVEVWATWCQPCVRGLSTLTDLATTHPDVRFVALAIDDQQEAVEAFFAESSGRTERLDVGWWSSEANPYEALQIGGVPSVFVLDRNQRVDTVVFGSDAPALEAALHRVLGPSTAGPP